jgi:hypothetical protein
MAGGDTQARGIASRSSPFRDFGARSRRRLRLSWRVYAFPHRRSAAPTRSLAGSGCSRMSCRIPRFQFFVQRGEGSLGLLRPELPVQRKTRSRGPYVLQRRDKSEQMLRHHKALFRGSLTQHRRRSLPIEFRLLFGGGRHAGADGFVRPPAAVPRHARPPKRFGFREDEPAPERQRTLREQEALHPFVTHEPRPVEETFASTRPFRR